MGGENDSAEGPADKDRWMRERTGGDAGARKGGGLVLHERLSSGGCFARKKRVGKKFALSWLNLDRC